MASSILPQQPPSTVLNYFSLLLGEKMIIIYALIFVSTSVTNYNGMVITIVLFADTHAKQESLHAKHLIKGEVTQNAFVNCLTQFSMHVSSLYNCDVINVIKTMHALPAQLTPQAGTEYNNKFQALHRTDNYYDNFKAIQICHFA